MVKHLDEILKIEQDTSDLRGMSYGTPWSKDNFLSERDKKWELSTISFVKDRVIGFLITSSYDGNKAHCHRGAMIATLPSDEKKRIFRSLYKKLDEAAKKNGFIYRTGTIPVENISTLKFYFNEDWVELTKREVEEFILLKDIDATIIDPNIMLDSHAPAGDPDKSLILKYLY